MTEIEKIGFITFVAGLSDEDSFKDFTTTTGKEAAAYWINLDENTKQEVLTFAKEGLSKLQLVAAEVF